MKQAIGMLLWMLLAIAAASVHETAAAVRELEQNVIRLHILADSDSTADQTEKLLVRDAVLAFAEKRLPADTDYETGCALISAALPEIRTLAEQTLRDSGCTDAVTVSFGENAFPARTYGDLTLPAGDYQALRIEIGSGKGQNWWCIMYPSLCIPAASDATAQTVSGILPADACALAAHPAKFELRLKCADLCIAAADKLRAQFRKTETPASPEREAGETETDQQPQPLLQPPLLQPHPQPLPQQENRRIRIMIHQMLLPQSLPHIVSTPFHRM